MTKFKKFTTATITIALAICVGEAKSTESSLQLEYDHWTIWYNCEKKGYDAFHYTTVPDGGKEQRHSNFHNEGRLPERCQQLSTGAYSAPDHNETTYDRGHGVHANIWDHSRELIRESNSMANIVPQASRLNRWGAWRYTEKLTECWRDHVTVEVWGGVIWGRNQDNDYFLASHGVHTPDLLWKVIRFSDGEVNAWIMPNDNTPEDDNIDDYLIHPAVIKTLISIDLPLDFIASEINTKQSRRLPEHCDLQ